MNIWAVYADYGGEGYGEPRAAFTTEEAARIWAKAKLGSERNWELCEVELDPSPPVKKRGGRHV